MPNACPIIITRGKNKGKACGDVNKKCRHKNNQCPYCGIRFTVETSYTRHISTCTGEGQMPIPPKQSVAVKVRSFHTGPKLVSLDSDMSREPQIRLIRDRNPSRSPPPTQYVSNQVLLRKIEKLERELEEVKQTPVQHHHWNIVLGMNFFDELVHKMGKDHAIDFLSSIAQEGKPVDVINKLYLEGTSPSEYPIACCDRNHFRYIDSEHRIVDDRGGHGISKIVTSGVHDALVSAANESLNVHGTREQFNNLQRYITDMKRSLPKDRIISELAHITSIPNHPFFTIIDTDTDTDTVNA